MNFFKYMMLACVLFSEMQIMADWSAPTTLSPYNHEANAPLIAVNATGYSIAVWTEIKADVSIIRSSTRTSQGSWSNPVTLSDSEEDAFNPSVAMNSDGTVAVVWTSFDGYYSTVKVKYRDFGNKWSETQSLSDPWTMAINPKVAIDNLGNLTVIWEEYENNSFTIQSIQRYFFGVWSNQTTVSDPGEFSLQPQLVVNGLGQAIIIWTAYDGFHYYVEASTFLGNNLWSNPVRLSWDESDAISPHVAINDAGDAIAVWSGYDGSNFAIQSSILTPEDGWSPAMVISGYSQSGHDPQIAIDWEGNGVAVWIGNDGNNNSVQSSTLYVNFSGMPGSWFWTDPVEVSNPGEDAAQPQVVVDPYGNAVASWTSLNGSHFVLQAATLPFGSVWTPGVAISNPALEAITPMLVIDGNGNPTLIWAEKYHYFVIQTSTGYDLFW